MERCRPVRSFKQKQQRSMTEIRVCWPYGLHENQLGEPTDGGTWSPDTPDARRELEIIVDAGNEVAGPGTHWLEEREA